MQRIKLSTHDALAMTTVLLLTVAMYRAPTATAQSTESTQPLETTTEKAQDGLSDAASRIARLESRVEALIARIIILETALAERERESLDPEVPAPETPLVLKRTNKNEPSIDSPEMIIERMQDDFQNDLLRDPSFVLGIDSPNIRAREEANRVLRNWVDKNTRLFNKPVTWNVQTLERKKQEDGDTLYLFKVIRSSGQDDSKTFEEIIPSRFGRRIKSWEEKVGFEGLTLKGFFEPDLRVTPVKTEINELKTEVIFERENDVALNEWIQFNYEFRLSSVLPRFNSDAEINKNSQKVEPKNEL